MQERKAEQEAISTGKQRRSRKAAGSQPQKDRAEHRRKCVGGCRDEVHENAEPDNFECQGGKPGKSEDEDGSAG
jgi:hypothetical protein